MSEKYKMNKRKFGNIGEKIAQKYLIKKGYEIITTNFYTRSGEIDIITKNENEIIFIEVKTRTNYNYGRPSESINKNKKKHMKNTARRFLSLNNYSKYNIRFDAIEVIIKNGKCEITHLKQIM